MLNGYARVVEYGTFSETENNLNPTASSKQNYLISITEGCFKRGELFGYGRVLKNSGSCSIGYWAPNQDSVERDSRAYGKFTDYNADGSFRRPQGAYIGGSQEEMTLLKALPIKDFQSNYNRDQMVKMIKAYKQTQANNL
jgi:hypothetical protein